MTPQEHLANEQNCDIKHEFVDGIIYAMAGASPNHGRIAANISRHFGNHLAQSKCETFTADMKVKTPTGSYRYPDVLVICDNQFIENQDMAEFLASASHDHRA